LSEYKLFVQRIGLVGITNILVAISSIILLPILTKNLSTSDYGIWNQVNITLILISNIAQVGLSYAMNRFLAGETDKTKIQEGVYSILAVVLGVSLVVAGALYIFSNEIGFLLLNNNHSVALLLPLTIIMSNMTFISLDFFRTFQKTRKYSIFYLSRSYLVLIFASVLLLLGYGIWGCVFGILISYTLLMVVMFAIIVSEIGFKIPRFKNIREYLNLSLPMVPGMVSSWIVDSSDRYVIGILLGTVFVGYYSAGYTLGTTIQLLVAPFSVLLLPVLSKNYEDKRKVKTVVKYSLRYYLALSIPAVFLLSILSKPILNILTTAEIASNGFLITPLVALGALLFGLYTILSQIIILTKKTKIIGVVWIIAAIINIALNLIAVPFIGIIGAALVTLVTYTVTLAFILVYSSRYMTLPFDLGFIVKSIFASAVAGAFVFLLNPQSLLGIVIVAVLGVILYTIVLIISKGFEKKEINFFMGFLRDILKDLKSVTARF